MTIDIIKNGRKDWKPKYRGTCRQCDCMVECSREDGHYTPDIRGEGDFVRINCPNCGMSMVCYRKRDISSIDPRDYGIDYFSR